MSFRLRCCVQCGQQRDAMKQVLTDARDDVDIFFCPNSHLPFCARACTSFTSYDANANMEPCDGCFLLPGYVNGLRRRKEVA